MLVTTSSPAKSTESLEMPFRDKLTWAQAMNYTGWCTLAPSCECDRSICTAVAMRPVATVTAMTRSPLFAPGATDKDGRLFTVLQEVRSASVIVRYFARDENIQVNGYSFVLDFSGVGAKHLTHWSTSDMRKWNDCWQVECE